MDEAGDKFRCEAQENNARSLQAEGMAYTGVKQIGFVC